jgi:dipeptidyl aminopeptidase/acylaminoacyl peptidase
MRTSPTAIRVLFSQVAVCLLSIATPWSGFAADAPTLQQLLGYPFVSNLVASDNGKRFAWVQNVGGVRNIYTATATDTTPKQLSHATADDGQELSQLTFSPDGSELIYVRGGDHDQNWAAKDNLAPDPDNDPAEPKVTLWSIDLDSPNAEPLLLTEGDSPALSSKGELAYVKDGHIWTTTMRQGKTSADQAHRLFFDRGRDDTPIWSPDGTKLAFVSGREDHSFIGIYTSAQQPLLYLSPSSSSDELPVWSPDGRSVAYMREPSHGDAPQNFLVQRPHPFAFWIADATTGKAHKVWSSPDTLAGSLPRLGENEPLFWMADDELVFTAELDNWPHLYAVNVAGGKDRLLTPGDWMVENVVQSPDRRTLVFSANAGNTKGDDDRRHLFRVGTDGHAPEVLTSGVGLEWSPIAHVSAGAQRPAAVAVLAKPGNGEVLDTGAAKEYPASALVVPKLVSFKSPDGLTIQGQIFTGSPANGKQPGLIFVHGGPTRQMMLGWNYMDYYSNAYALNQYLALHGFTVLSVNYRLGIGYGRAFQHPAHAGAAGAAEYQDVLAAARYLQQLPGVDAQRIGIWGGSYGGYLTGLALARNSDVFKAGVDFHGISNWVPTLAKDGALPEHWYGTDADWKQAIATAFAASPEADIAKWKSPVLLIQGDDDRNVLFDQTVELAHQLEQRHIPYEELIIPNEIHGFLRRIDWMRADEATAQFFLRQLGMETTSK